MADYVARVELRGEASVAEYQELGREMEKVGFHLEIPATKGDGTYDSEMPHATYFGSSHADVPVAEVCKSVVAAIQVVQRNYVLFVAQVSDWVWGRETE